MGLQCEVGLRCRSYYVLCGSVLSVWNELEEVLTPVGGTNVKVQIVRLRTDDGQRIVGKLKARWTPEGSSSIRWCDLQPPLGSRGTPLSCLQLLVSVPFRGNSSVLIPL